MMTTINADVIPHVMFIGGIGGWELFIIFLIVLLLFGAKRLPEIAKSMGKAINEFKKTKDDIMNYAEDSKDDSSNPQVKTKKLETDTTVYDKAEKQDEPKHSA